MKLPLRLNYKKSIIVREFAPHTDKVGILPGEEMVCADITKSVISTDNTPSGNTHIQNANREWVDPDGVAKKETGTH